VRSSQSSAPRWVWILLALSYAALTANYLVHEAIDFDDNWITYRYARNLMEGRGFVFNPTDPVPTEGFTSIFHVVFTALGLRMGFDPLRFTQLTSLLLLALIPPFTLGWLRRIWPEAPVYCLIPFVLYLAAAATAWQVGSGMETIFFAIGTFLLAVLAARVTSSGAAKLSLLLGLAGFALVLVRPEGGLLVAAHLALVALLGWRHGWRRSLVNLAVAGGAFSAGLLAYGIWKAKAIGSLVPNSYYVKTYGGVFGIPRESWPGMKHVIQFLASFEFGFPQAATLLVVLFFLRPRAAWLDPARSLLIHLLLPTFGLLAYYIRIIHESCQFRLEFTVLLPMLAAAAVLIASPGGSRAGTPEALRFPVPRLVALLAACFALWMAEPWNWRLVPGVLRGRSPAAGGIHFEIGEDLKRAGLGPDLVLMTGAVGATAWVSDASTLDFVGLTDEVLCGRVRRDLPAVERYVRARNADVISVKWPPAQAARKEDDPAFQGVLKGGSGKYGEGLMVRLYRSEAFLDFVHFVMRDIRDRYELVAVYGDGPFMIYVLRDSPKADAVRRAFKASPYILRGIDPAAYVKMKAAAGEMDPY
jgi:hypothetical protein